MERERRKVLAGRSRQFVSGALRLVRFFEQSGRLQHPGELDEGLRLLEELLVVEATGDIRKVSLCLGHASIQSTEIYLRRDPTGKLDVLAARLPPVNRKGSFKEAPDRLLAIDELGYLAYDARAADLLFQLVSRRYEHRSLLITTNLPFKHWDTVFPNASWAVALIDRLTHHVEILVLEGRSYRRREAELTQQQRKRRRPRRDDPTDSRDPTPVDEVGR